MPSAEPIKLYLEAVEEYKQGNNENAANLLASALGAEKPSETIRNALPKLLSLDTLPNDAILKIVSTEVSRGKK